MPVAPSDDFESTFAATGDELERLVARLSRLSPLAWRTRRDAAESLLQTLVSVCESQQGRRLPVPQVDSHVLADAIAVIGRECLDGLAHSPQDDLLAQLRAGIDRALAATR